MKCRTRKINVVCSLVDNGYESVGESLPVKPRCGIYRDPRIIFNYIRFGVKM